MKNVNPVTMRKSLFLVVFSLFISSFIASAQVNSRDISVGEFSKIVVDGPFNINFSSSKCFVKAVSSEKDIIDLLVVSNVDGTLKISIDESKKKSWRTLWGNTIAVDLFIGCPLVSEIRLSGVGKISTLNTLKSNDLVMVIDGVNKSEVTVDAKDIQLTVSGIGEYLFKGNAEKIDINFSGIGSFDSSLLDVKSLVMTSSGIGNCTVKASNDIVINSSGIGNITYLGSPQIQKIHKSGIGSLKAQ